MEDIHTQLTEIEKQLVEHERIASRIESLRDRFKRIGMDAPTALDELAAEAATAKEEMKQLTKADVVARIEAEAKVEAVGAAKIAVA